jgi:hypothetical protein
MTEIIKVKKKLTFKIYAIYLKIKTLKKFRRNRKEIRKINKNL